ncbi:MAG: nucleotidyltransferase domain-containing protein [Sulfuricurvum sp.]|jgi:predicted nucleotidyltransferase|uniref:nucleotidyltransferase domain-containing protein n=1 Tax=Sulfuricurvum sp. TaxID=2025608 RepID=UPI0025FD15BE|nr:nucleotidyltransferase domain-containing protein [Sulfuricurvum sp.]MCK9373981.1 nucleotidyltransferase domain-containing protein [Sulfuricurvum sp.]
MQELYGLRADIIEKIVDTIKKNLKIQKIILFGSRAKETYKKGSDIDISIVSEGLSLKELNQLKVMLDDLMLPYKIDLLDYGRISNNDLKEHINRVGKILAG